MNKINTALLIIAVSTGLASCARYAWTNPQTTEPGALNMAVGECTSESYRVVPVPQIQPPARPNYQASGTEYQTDYRLQSSNGTYVTGTATTTQKSDMWATQQQYQAAKSAYDSQMRKVQFARQEVFNGCMQAKGWIYSKITP